MVIIATYEDILATYSSEFHGRKALEKYKKWFPIESSERLAGIIADLIGDGHLQEQKLRIDYTSKSRKELMRFNKEIYDKFGLRGKIRINKTNKYGTMNLGVNNKPLGRVLQFIGVPAGAKVFKSFAIPDWILENKRFFSRFINRLYSCEGCVDRFSACIDFDMYKHENLINNHFEFFFQIKNGLKEHFGIECTQPFLKGKSVRKDTKITLGIHMKIKKKESLNLFASEIGFDNKEKMKKLLEIIG